MIPLADIISRVRTKFEQPGSTRWSDSAITQAINEGLETLAEATSFYERYVTIPLGNNRRWYDLRGFTPETVVRIRSVWSSNRNEWLRPVSIEDLPYDWMKSVGEPQTFWTRGIHWLGVYPYETSGTGWLRVFFSGIPSRFAGTPSVLYDLPDDHVPALEDYALYQLSAMDREHDRAIGHFQAYIQRERDLSHFVDGRLVAGGSGRLYNHIRGS